jgi:hypothetical protein
MWAFEFVLCCFIFVIYFNFLALTIFPYCSYFSSHMQLFTFDLCKVWWKKKHATPTNCTTWFVINLETSRK